MIHTTFAKAKEAGGASCDSYRKMVKHLGGVETYGKDTPIPLSLVVEVCGLDAAIWCFQCTVESSEKIMVEFACFSIEHALPNLEQLYTEDKRLRGVIEASQKLGHGEITLEELRVEASVATLAEAAWLVAWSAACSVAWSAAWSAACSTEAEAAWSAEREWQKQMLLKLLQEAE